MTTQLLAKEDFLRAIELTPLVSIDLVICSAERHVLMGERVNRPAAGYWFVPGGRICKDETLEEAFRRISATELGISCDIATARLMGAFTHLYVDNFAAVAGISTHYVALAYQLNLTLDLSTLPEQQHQAYRWLAADSGMNVHPNSQTYFGYLI